MFIRKLALFLVILTILMGYSAQLGGALAADKLQAPVPASTPTPQPMSLDVKNSESMLIIFITPPEVVKNLVPAPLAPSPYNIMYVAVSRSPIPEGTGYNHVMELGVLAVFKGKMYTYPVYSLVDNKPMSDRGGMITGSPIKIGRITLDKKDKNLTASVEREGKTLFKATMVLAEPGEPLDSSPMVVLRNIPAAQKDGQPEVKQLIAGKIENIKVHELIDGEADMEFDQSLTDGFPKVSVQQVYRAVYRKADFTLTSAGVLHDYLKTE
jgi:acetoacetate decarboxylase